MSSIRKAGVTFYPGVGVSPDLIGLADTFSLKYKKRGNTDYTSISDSFVEENPGTYTVPLTLTEVGDYIVIIESTDDRIENLEGNVLVTNASIDDINDAVNALQTDITAIKEQVDVLDEAELNGIAEQVAEVNTTVEDIKKLIEDTNLTIKIGGDGTSTFVPGAVIEGNNSGATGTIVSSTYDADEDLTALELKEVQGEFELGENFKVDGVDDPDLRRVEVIVGNPLNSVMEFVEAINDALSGGASSLSVLESYTDNLELMLEGKEYTDTEGNVVTESDSKGLIEIFAEIDTQSSTVQTKIDDLRTYVEGVQTSINDVIGSATDDETAETVFGKIQAVKLVVDANKSHLENSGYGLSALKDLLDTMSTNASTHDTDIKAILNDGTNGLESIKDTIMSKLDAMDAKIDNISASTGSRIFI